MYFSYPTHVNSDTEVMVTSYALLMFHFQWLLRKMGCLWYLLFCIFFIFGNCSSCTFNLQIFHFYGHVIWQYMYVWAWKHIWLLLILLLFIIFVHWLHFHCLYFPLLLVHQNFIISPIGYNRGYVTSLVSILYKTIFEFSTNIFC